MSISIYIKHLSFCHNILEAQVVNWHAEIGTTASFLYKGIKLQDSRIQRLEIARKRQIAIQLHHIRDALDPERSWTNGTLQRLQELMREEIEAQESDKVAIEQDCAIALESSTCDEEIYESTKAVVKKDWNVTKHVLTK